MAKQKFNVTGMTCSACSAHVEKAVNKLEGVKRAEVSLMTNSMTAEYDEAALTPQDIIQTVVLRTGENLLKFCRGIQSGSPVDSFVTPEAWQMPGYEDEVVMAAGAFIQGSSIELSCDGPMREPYMAFLQGGLTYEAGRLGVMAGIAEMLA